MKNRLFTSFFILFTLAIAFILKVYVSNYFFDVLTAVVAVIAAYEMSKLFTKMGRYNDKILAMIFAAAEFLFVMLALRADDTLGVVYTIVISVSLMLVFFGITFLVSFIFRKNTMYEMKARKVEKERTVAGYSLIKALNTLVIFVYPVFLLLFLVYINHFDSMTTSFSVLKDTNGWISFYLVMFVLLVPMFTDTFAYIIGNLCGGKKLAPKISPNKTISGAIGGSLFCGILSVVVFFIFNAVPSMATLFTKTGITVWIVLAFSLVGSVIAQCGDLFESWLKRTAGVKDAGKILPGHGGMLDRFDSYLFELPVMFMAFSILFSVI